MNVFTIIMHFMFATPCWYGYYSTSYRRCTLY